MKKSNYIIKYTAQDKKGVVFKSGIMKVKRQSSSIAAQVNLEGFLKKKYPSFDRLAVQSCEEENPFNSMFGDAFNSNPFGF